MQPAVCMSGEMYLEQLFALGGGDEIRETNLACHESLPHDRGKVDVDCSRDVAGTEGKDRSTVQQQHQLLEGRGREKLELRHKACKIPYSAYISRIFNFANLESFMKFIQLKFETLHCNTHGQHEFAKFFQQIPSKQLFTKI